MKRVMFLFVLLISVSGCIPGQVGEPIKIVSSATPIIMPTDTQNPEPSNTPVPTETKMPTTLPATTPTKEPDPTEEIVEPTPTLWGAPTEQENFKVIAIYYSDQGSVEKEIFFIDELAFSIPDDQELDIIFDLDQESWTDLETGEVNDLGYCSFFAEQTKIAMDKELLDYPEGAEKRFFESLFYPFYEVAELENGNLVINNEFFTYQASTIKGIPQRRLKQFFLYDKLNTYYEFMYQDGFAPFQRLEVIQELWDRNLFPGEIELEIDSPNGKSKMRTTYEIVELTSREIEMLHSILAQSEPV